MLIESFLKGKGRSCKYRHCHMGGLKALDKPVQFACSYDMFYRNTFDILPPLGMKLFSFSRAKTHTSPARS